MVAIGCGGSSGSPTSPPIPSPPGGGTGNASFRVVDAGGGEEFFSFGGGNHVVCRTNFGFADLFVRLARDQSADGENSPHIDFDICSHEQGGVFDPQSPQTASCGDLPVFSMFWHEQNGTVYSNAVGAACALELTVVNASGALMGTFSCAGLEEFGGTRTVDVLDGSFDCIVE